MAGGLVTAGGGAGSRLHHSYTYDVLAMDTYAFGEAELVEELERAVADADVAVG